MCAVAWRVDGIPLAYRIDDKCHVHVGSPFLDPCVQRRDGHTQVVYVRIRQGATRATFLLILDVPSGLSVAVDGGWGPKARARRHIAWVGR